MSTVNYYDLLDVTPDCSTRDIKRAYVILAPKLHPDKGGDAEMFELVTEAYNVLNNPKTRKTYDENYALLKHYNTDHFDLKNKSRDFYTAIVNESKKDKKNSQEDEFNEIYQNMDRKHGYRRDQNNEKELDERKTKKRIKDLELARQHDDIENIYDQIFDGNTFVLEKFNAAFDAMYKDHNELIPHTGNPLPYNNMDDNNFGSIDNYETLYDDNALGNSTFGSIKLDEGKKKNIILTKDDINKIAEVKYTKGHNYKDKSYSKTLDEKLREYESITKKLEKRERADFNKEDDCGGYGILHQIKDLDTSMYDNQVNLTEKYNKLLEARKAKN